MDANAYRFTEKVFNPLLDERQSEDAIDGGALTRLAPQTRVNQVSQIPAVPTGHCGVRAPGKKMGWLQNNSISKTCSNI